MDQADKAEAVLAAFRDEAQCLECHVDWPRRMLNRQLAICPMCMQQRMIIEMERYHAMTKVVLDGLIRDVAYCVTNIQARLARLEYDNARRGWNDSA